MNDKDKLLNSFMQEFFPYIEFRKAGIFTKEMKNDYQAQAQRICNRLGLKSIYEYGSKEISCHLSYEGNRPTFVNKQGKLKTEPFVTTFKNIYD